MNAQNNLRSKATQTWVPLKWRTLSNQLSMGARDLLNLLEPTDIGTPCLYGEQRAFLLQCGPQPMRTGQTLWQIRAANNGSQGVRSELVLWHPQEDSLMHDKKGGIVLGGNNEPLPFRDPTMA